jgi:hypothetical protein
MHWKDAGECSTHCRWEVMPGIQNFTCIVATLFGKEAANNSTN